MASVQPLLHDPLTHNLKHSLQRWREAFIPRAGTEKDVIGWQSCQSKLKQCETCPQMTSPTEAVQMNRILD